MGGFVEAGVFEIVDVVEGLSWDGGEDDGEDE